MGIQLSVVICTYNRCESLKVTLESLLRQETSESFDYEIIVVDNNSTDQTKSTVESFRDKFNGRLRYVFEKQQGLSFARNRGVSEGSGEIVVFTDDDCIASKDWIQNLANLFLEHKEIGVITGKTCSYDSTAIMYSMKISSNREIFQYPSNPWDIGNGNNFAVRRNVFKEMGGFKCNFGAGTQIGSAEDTEYFYRALKNKHDIMYDPSAIIFHNHGRLTEKEIVSVELNYAKGRGAFYLNNIADLFVVKLFYYEVRRLLSKWLTSFKNRDLELRKKVFRNIKGLFLGDVFFLKSSFSKMLKFCS